jgi:hypothetical protein
MEKGRLMLQTAKQFTVDTDWRKFAKVLEGEFDIQRHVIKDPFKFTIQRSF